MDEELLARLDRHVHVRRHGRSAVLRRAAAEYLARQRRAEITRQYREGYGTHAGGLGERLQRVGERSRMDERIGRGDIWLFSFPRPDKRRPVLVLTRPEVIELLHTVMVAPVTSAIRGTPSDVLVGEQEGLKHASAVNLDHVQTVEKARLRKRVAAVGPEKMNAVCRALAVAVGVRRRLTTCDGFRVANPASINRGWC